MARETRSKKSAKAEGEPGDIVGDGNPHPLRQLAEDRKRRKARAAAESTARALRQFSGLHLGQASRAVAAPELDATPEPTPSRARARVDVSEAATTEPAPRLRKRQRRELAKRTNDEGGTR